MRGAQGAAGVRDGAAVGRERRGVGEQGEDGQEGSEGERQVEKGNDRGGRES